MKKLLLMKTLLLLCALIVGSMNGWAADVTLTASSGFSSSYSSDRTSTMAGVGFKDSGVMYNGKNQPSGFAAKQVIQMRKSQSGAGEIYNTSAISTITSVEVTLVNNNNGFTLYYGTTQNPSTNSIASSSLTPVTGTFSYTNTSDGTSSATSYKFTFDLSSYDPTYIKIVNGSNANYVGNIVINYAAAAPTQVATPTFDPAAGAVAYNSSVSISCATADATIHYTTNGTDPTSSSATYSSPIAITAATTIKAIAVKDGLTDSEIGTAAYTIAAPDAPNFNVASGAIPAGTKVTITGTGTIRYTTNGIDPTSSTGTVYSDPVEINSNCTLKAICVDGGGNASSVTSANYGIIIPVTGYTIDFESVPAAYTDWTMTNVERGSGTISAHGGTYYGTTGGKASASIVTAAKVAKPETLTFYVSKTTTNATSSTWYVEVSSDGSSWDEITTQDATSMTAGSWTKVQCDIVDGSDDPYENVYVRIRYAGSTAVRTIDDITLTEVMPVATPTFSVDAGTYTSVQSVTITCGTAGATIYYTTDGSDPTSSSTEYTSAVSIDHSCTLKAIAIKGDDESNIASAAYTINLPVDYNLVTSITPGKTYVIAGGKDDGTVQIMAGQASNNRTTVSGTVSETTLTTANNPAEVVVYGPDASGNYTLYTTNGYLYAASSGSNYLRSQTTNDLNGKWDIEIDGDTKEANVVAQGSNSNKNMRFNSTLFSCYGDGSSVTALVYFFEKAGSPVATTTSVKLNSYGYATFATTTALDFLDADDASYSAWQISSANSSTGVITFSQIKGHVAAGKGILLKGTAGATINLNILPAGGDALSSNKLVGITSATEVADNAYYGLSGNKFVKVNAGTVPAGKALLPATEVSSARELTFVFEDSETTGVENVNRETITNNQFFDLSGRKVANPAKGLYIVNGKKVIIK